MANKTKLRILLWMQGKWQRNLVTGDKVRGRVSHCPQTQLSLKAESVSPFLRWNFPLNTRCKSVRRRGFQGVITVIREQLLAVIKSSTVTPQVSASTAACGAGGAGGGSVLPSRPPRCPQPLGGSRNLTVKPPSNIRSNSLREEHGALYFSQ